MNSLVLFVYTNFQALLSGDELSYGNQRKDTNLAIGFDAGELVDNLLQLTGANFNENPAFFGVNYGLGKPYLKVNNQVSKQFMLSLFY